MTQRGDDRWRVIGWLTDRAAGLTKDRTLCVGGCHLSPSFLVDENLIGIVIALTDISVGKTGVLPLYTGDGFPLRTLVSLALFAGRTLVFYRFVSRKVLAQRASASLRHCTQRSWS